jgi:hypothetical protein
MISSHGIRNHWPTLVRAWPTMRFFPISFLQGQEHPPEAKVIEVGPLSLWCTRLTASLKSQRENSAIGPDLTSFARGCDIRPRRNSCKAIGLRNVNRTETRNLPFGAGALHRIKVVSSPCRWGEMGIATDILNLRNNQLSSVTMLISALERFASR